MIFNIRVVKRLGGGGGGGVGELSSKKDQGVYVGGGACASFSSISLWSFSSVFSSQPTWCL